MEIDGFEQDDVEWLYIRLKVNSKLGSLEVTDPFLRFQDVKEVINWFRDLADNKPQVVRRLQFIEPNIEFEITAYDNDSKQLRIIFNWECRPKPPKNIEYYVDCSLTNEQLSRISNDFLVGLQKFVSDNQYPFDINSH